MVGPGQAHQVAELALAPLGLGGALAAHVLLDEGLLLADQVLLLQPRLVVGGVALLLQLDVLRVVAGVAHQLPTLQLDDRFDGVLQEAPVVADHHHRARGLADVLLDPLDPRQVEVVGRLVEQEEVVPAGECAGHRRAALLTAGEGARLALPERLDEADPSHHHLDPPLDLPAAELFDAFGEAPVLGHQPLERRALRPGHLLGDPLQPFDRLAGALHPPLDVLAHGDAGIELGALGDVAEVGALADDDPAPVRRGEPFDQPEEGGLTAAVAAYDPHLLTGVDLQVRPGEHLLGAVVLLYVLEAEQAH